MAIVELGKQKTDRPQTPTLRQWAKNRETFPGQSHVTTIFKPNKLPYWTLIVDHGFKVVVQEDNPLHGVITDSLDDWFKEDGALVVVLHDVEKGSWSLGMDTNENADWEEFQWGYKCTIKNKPPTAKASKGKNSP